MNEDSPQNANPEGIARLKLALAIGFGLKYVLSESEIKLLELDFLVAPNIANLPETWNRVLEECVEIIAAWHMEAIPQVVDVQKEYQKMAIALLKQIEADGGKMPYFKLDSLPEPIRNELIAKMSEDRLIVRGLNGIVWGINARRAIKEYGHLVE